MPKSRNATTQHTGMARAVSVTLLLTFSVAMIMLAAPLASWAEVLATGLAPRRIADAGPVACASLFGIVGVAVVCVLRAMWWVEAANAAGSHQVRG